MKTETASQRLYYEIQSHLSDLKHETIGWNKFEELMEQSHKDAIALEKQQIIYAYVKGQSDCDMFTMESEAEEYYDQTFIF